MGKILITGSLGQLGLVLMKELVKIHGQENVLATDLTHKPHNIPCAYEPLDITDKKAFVHILNKYHIREIYHLAALLSATGEKKPLVAWDINLNAFLDILELGVKFKIEKIFFPSSIAVFGPTTPKTDTPQDSPLLPTTVYGISKVTGELWCNYYYKKYGLDVRSLRYPGIIGYQSLPGGGTTDYAVEIFHEALKMGHYECFLDRNTVLPMMYMEDAMRATIMLMSAKKEKIKLRYGYNVASMSFSPEQIYDEIKKHISTFTIRYKPDFRQAIAGSWNRSIDDSMARQHWDWKPKYDLSSMVTDMIHHLAPTYETTH